MLEGIFSEPRPEGRGIVGRGFASPPNFGFKLPRPKGRGFLFLDKNILGITRKIMGIQPGGYQ